MPDATPNDSPGVVRMSTAALSVGCALIALVALADLAVRAALRLEIRWDTFAYHVPFDALRGGLSIPYEMSDTVKGLYEGFPPLPHLMQGALWRLTGSLNATGVVNYLAFAAFLTYSHVVLRARFWIVGLIALTAPMVLIHTTVSYIDLFGNSLLAIGASSCLYVYLFPDRRSRVPMIGAHVGLVGAAWSKYQLVPVAALLFCLLLVVSLRWAHRAGSSRRYVAILFLVAATIAAVPYAKNLVEYGNPLWPIRLPGNVFPYQVDVLADLAQKPPPLKDYSTPQLFVNSLLEIDHPTHYDYRPRWIIDQGNSFIAFRMGGFWGTGVVIYVTAMVAALASFSVLGLIAFLPQSHELRYYLFIPLTWAAAIGMLYPHLAKRLPTVAPFFLALVLGLFLYMASENWTHYEVTRVDYLEAAREWGATEWWPRFERGERYCAVDMLPIGILLTGPTMSEYSIVDRSSAALCPAGSIVVTKDGVGARK